MQNYYFNFSSTFILITSISTDSGRCAYALKSVGELPNNTIFRNYKIMNKHHLSCLKELVQKV